MRGRALLLSWFFVFATLLASIGVGNAPAGDWKSLFDGTSLGDWKKTSFGGGEGDVSVTDGAIVLEVGKDLTGVTWTGAHPKTNYEIALDAMRVEGNDFFCGLTFPVGDTACSFICGGWGGEICGLSCLDGEDAATNETTQTMKFEKGRWYHVRVRVTDKRITAWIDDTQLVDVDIDGRKVSVRFEVEPSQPLGIATWRTKGAAKNIQWRELSKDEVQSTKD
jgi:hypothetical protein